MCSRIWLLFPLDNSGRPPVRSPPRRSGPIRDYLARLGAGLPQEPSDISSVSCLFPSEGKGGASLLGATICLGTRSRPESSRSSSPSPPSQQHPSVCFILLTFSTLASRWLRWREQLMVLTVVQMLLLSFKRLILHRVSRARLPGAHRVCRGEELQEMTSHGPYVEGSLAPLTHQSVLRFFLSQKVHVQKVTVGSGNRLHELKYRRLGCDRSVATFERKIKRNKARRERAEV